MKAQGAARLARREDPDAEARAQAAVASEARRLVRDLFRRSTRRYWIDLVVSASVGYGAVALYLTAPSRSARGIAALAVAAFSLFRAGAFIHEIAHFRRGETKAFVVGWNVLVGIPLGTPSHFYGNHKDHHHPGKYATPQDGEYLPFARAPVTRIVLYFLQPFTLPPLAVVRFVLLAPLSAVSPTLRRWVLRHATSYVTNPYYERPEPLPPLRGWPLAAELGSGLVLSAILGAWMAGPLAGAIVLKIYVVAVLAIELNWIRNLAGHRFGNAGEPLSIDEQFAESLTVLGPPVLVELLFPVGLRYHALHHLLPGIPYHRLAEAHRRLLSELSPGPRSLYRWTFRPGVASALADVWRSARSRGDCSIIPWWRARARAAGPRLPDATPQTSAGALGPPDVRASVGARVIGRVRRVPRRQFVLALVGFAAYLVAMRLSGGNRPEQFVICGAILLLVLWSDATRRFFTGMLPFLLFGIVTDLSRIAQPLFQRLTIHVEEPYRFDKLVFGIRTASGVLTPNEFFAIHHWPAVDLVTGTAYIVFVWWAIGFAAYLALFRQDAAGRLLLRRFGWAFLAMNVAGIVTYYLYPAAPPWYVVEYGLGPVHREARASLAGTARWDALTGIPYFAAFYGRSADVFGAIPSLHVSYPLLTYLFGRALRKRWLDAASFALFLLVAFAAVYLDHHYVRDVLLGAAYAIATWAIARPLARSGDLGARSGSTDGLRPARAASAEAPPRTTAA